MDKLQEKCQKYEEKYHKFKTGYLQLKKKLGEVDRRNNKYIEELKKIIQNKNEELEKSKIVIDRYKKNSLDFVTRKKVLELKQIVNDKEELIYKLNKKLEEQDEIIKNHYNDTKDMREENKNIKESVIQLYTTIKKYITLSSDDEKEEEEVILNSSDTED
jgi:hypothetical protein